MLYQVLYPTGVIKEVGPVLVQKTPFGVKELLTGYSKIDIITKDSLAPDRERLDIHSFFWKSTRATNEGAHLVVYQDSFCARNKVKAEDIDVYLKENENSNWKKLYEEMKVFTSKDIAKLKKKVRQVRNTQK